MSALDKWLAKWVAKNPEAEPALMKILGLEKEREKAWLKHKAIRDLGGPEGSKGWTEMSWAHRPDYHQDINHIDRQIKDLKGQIPRDAYGDLDHSLFQWTLHDRSKNWWED